MTSLARLTTRVADWARTEPSRDALVEGERSLSYGELWSAVRRLAGSFRARGLGPAEAVAVILPNCLEAVVVAYATWLAGGVLVPLNAQARGRDFGRWLGDSSARFVVFEEGNRDVEEALAGLATPPERLLVTKGPDGPFFATVPVVADLPDDCAEPADDTLAMILFTSGTTGRPKGVMLSHANLAANVESILAYLALSSSDSIVTILPFYYSYGASVLHTHLGVGARLVIEPNLVFPHLVIETVARERVTGFSGVPSTFALMLKRVQLAKYDLSSLRYLTQAGGGMAPVLIQRLRAALPHAPLYVMYGQTEATARLTYLPPERLDDKLGSAGRPIPNVSLEVRREDGSQAASGEVGEVWARGPNVMLGIWRDPQATAEVVRDGWLRTGDMGYLDGEGFLFLSGRRSDMIKTGAHRIHPAELEEVIAEVPGVVEAAAIGVDDEILGQSVKAFVVADGAVSAEAIKAHCRERLAAYKVPKYIELVAALPKTASGKVQRAFLANKQATEES